MDVLKSTECRYFYERAWWALRRALAGTPAATSTAPTLPLAKPPVVVPKVVPPAAVQTHPAAVQKPASSPAEQGETLNPGAIPPQPVGEEADKLHQYKKEASSQQSP